MVDTRLETAPASGGAAARASGATRFEAPPDRARLEENVRTIESYLAGGGTLTDTQRRTHERNKAQLIQTRRGVGGAGLEPPAPRTPFESIGRGLSLAAQVPYRAALDLLGLPGDIAYLVEGAINRLAPETREMLVRTAPAGPAALVVALERAGLGQYVRQFIPPTTPELQEAFTQLPTTVGMQPLARPETGAERVAEMGARSGIQSAMGAALGIPGFQAVRASAPPGQVLTRSQQATARAASTQPFRPQRLPAGFRATPEQLATETLSGAVSGATAQAAQEAGMGPVGVLGGGVAGGQLGYKMAEMLRRLPNMTPRAWMSLLSIGQRAQRMLAGGTPMEQVQRFVLSEAERQGIADVVPQIQEALRQQGVAPQEMFEGAMQPIFQPTLGGVTGAPGLMAVETANIPALADPQAALARRREAMSESLRRRLYQEGGMTQPTGPLAGTREFPVTTEPVAQAMQPRMQQELGAARTTAGEQIAGLEARKGLAVESAEQARARIVEQRQQTLGDITTSLEGQKAAITARTMQAHRERTARILARNEQRLASAEKRFQQIAEQELKSGRTAPSRETGQIIRDASQAALNDLHTWARDAYAPFQDSSIAAQVPDFLAQLDALRLDAEAAQRLGDYPAGAVAQFRQALQQKVEKGGNPADAEATFADLMHLRTNLLKHQRTVGPNHWLNGVITATHDALADVAERAGYPELKAQLDEVSSQYRRFIRPFVTSVGEAILQKSSKAWSQYRTTPSRVAAKIYGKNATAEDVEQFVTLVDTQFPGVTPTANRRMAKEALTEYVAHQMFLELDPAARNVTEAMLTNWRNRHQEMFTALEQGGMGDVARRFERLRDVQQQVAGIKAAGARRAEQLQELSPRFKEQQGTELAGAEREAREAGARARALATEETADATRAERIAVGDIDAEIKATQGAAKAQERDIYQRYFAREGEDAAQVEARLAQSLRSPNPPRLANTVREMRQQVQGDAAAEATVRSAVLEELWRRAQGRPDAFEALLNTNRAALTAAGVTADSRAVLGEYLSMLRQQERTQPARQAAGADAQLGQLFRAGAIEQTFARAGMILGGIAAARYGYRLGAAGGQPTRGVAGAITGRTVGGFLGRSMAASVGAALGRGYDRQVAALLEEAVLRPDLAKTLRQIEQQQAVTPEIRARLYAYMITLGLPTRAAVPPQPAQETGQSAQETEHP